MSENRLVKKLTGFDCAPKDRFYFLLMREMKMEEFVLYELYSVLADWFTKHIGYGSLMATDAELSQILGWKNPSTVNRYKNSLIAKGHLVRMENGAIHPKGYERWTSQYWQEVRRKKKLNADMQIDIADSHFDYADMQIFEANNVSYKENVRLNIPKVINTVEDFELVCGEIFWNGDFGGMKKAIASYESNN